MASPEPVDTRHVAEYDRFRRELSDAGFTSRDGGRTWEGPIDPALRDFTKSSRMEITIQDGWPYRHPQLRVRGFEAVEHVDADGTICLWRTGDASRQWLTLDGWRSRIREWVSRQESGFHADDATMDAHVYFAERDPRLAIVDLSRVCNGAEDGEHGPLHARWRGSPGFLELTTHRAGRHLEGRWFFQKHVSAPPRDLEAFEALLTADQRTAFRTLLNRVRTGKKAVALLVWSEHGRFNGLAIRLVPDLDTRLNGLKGHARTKVLRMIQPKALAMELAPTDDDVMLARAGSDASELADKQVVIFGVGAVGSHIALQLASCGVGELTLVDRDLVRPGNLVRHVSPDDFVGYPKTTATAAVIHQHAPWTEIVEIEESPWGPSRLRQLIDDQDVIVDATGSAGFADQLAVLVEESYETVKPLTLVTASLYRQGAVARICRQGKGDVPLRHRTEADGYLAIPSAPGGEPVILEAGCSAPVNSASPHAVVSCASLAVQAILDRLLCAHRLPDELVEVYRPLEQPPFDAVGRVPSG